MNAIQRLRLAGSLALIVSLAMTASCAEQRVEAPPEPSVPEALPPSPAPPELLPTPEIDWHQAELSPGFWQWSMEAGQSVARFANGQLVLRCDRSNATIALIRAGTGTGEVPMTVLTSSEIRPLVGSAAPGPPPTVSVSLPASDPLLDAMAFSRGRFAVEVAGLPTLYVPSWAEVSRVIEDCR